MHAIRWTGIHGVKKLLNGLMSMNYKCVQMASLILRQNSIAGNTCDHASVVYQRVLFKAIINMTIAVNGAHSAPYIWIPAKAGMTKKFHLVL